MILVTGATGNVGRHVMSELLAAGEEVRALTRRPEQVGLPEGVEVVEGDIARPETLHDALAGARRAFLFPVFGQLGGFLEAANEAGLQHVVLLSAAAVREEHSGALGRMHAECEQAVAASGLSWTFIRPGAFMANDLRWAHGIMSDAVVRAPFGRAVTTPIDERDIAGVAARALLDKEHAGRTYELTGPQALTAVERVRVLGHALGRDLRFEEQSVAEARAEMATHTPADLVESSLELFASLVDTDAEVLPTVQDVTGQPPHTYQDWVAWHLGDFR